MNYLGVNIYAHNHGARLRVAGSGSVPPAPAPFACPVCLEDTMVSDGRVRWHLERGGFTQCPAGGLTTEVATRRAATMTADFRLPGESALRDE